MNKKIWDLYAPIYEKAMRMDQKYYAYMYKRISRRVVDKGDIRRALSAAFGQKF